MIFIELDIISEWGIGHWSTNNTPLVPEQWSLVNHFSAFLLVWSWKRALRTWAKKCCPRGKYNDFKRQRVSYINFLAKSVSSPDAGEKVKMTAPNKTRVPFAGVFADSLYVSNLMKCIYKPRPDVKESNCEFSSFEPYKPPKQFSWWLWVSVYAETGCGLSPLVGISPFGQLVGTRIKTLEDIQGILGELGGWQSAVTHSCVHSKCFELFLLIYYFTHLALARCVYLQIFA